jgi:hypothetical protein
MEMMFFEFVLPFLVPPLLGWVIGSLVMRPRAVTGGIIGGTAGGWLGVGLYRGVSASPDGSLLVYSAHVLIGACAGASLLAWLVYRRRPNE